MLAGNTVKIAGFIGVFSAISAIAQAQDLMTAGTIATKMTAEQRVSYEAGVIEGLAYARYLMDNRQEDGMNCIYDWYFSEGKAQRELLKAYDAYPDHTVGPIVWALVKRECGG